MNDDDQIPRWAFYVSYGLTALFVSLAVMSYAGLIAPAKPPTGIIM